MKLASIKRIQEQSSQKKETGRYGQYQYAIKTSEIDYKSCSRSSVEAHAKELRRKYYFSRRKDVLEALVSCS